MNAARFALVLANDPVMTVRPPNPASEGPVRAPRLAASPGI
jgi:hypothetical protein